MPPHARRGRCGGGRGRGRPRARRPTWLPACLLAASRSAASAQLRRLLRRLLDDRLGHRHRRGLVAERVGRLGGERRRCASGCRRTGRSAAGGRRRAAAASGRPARARARPRPAGRAGRSWRPRPRPRSPGPTLGPSGATVTRRSRSTRTSSRAWSNAGGGHPRGGEREVRELRAVDGPGDGLSPSLRGTSLYDRIRSASHVRSAVPAGPRLCR